MKEDNAIVEAKTELAKEPEVRIVGHSKAEVKKIETRTDKAQRAVDTFRKGLNDASKAADFVNNNFNFDAAMGSFSGFSKEKKKGDLITW